MWLTHVTATLTTTLTPTPTSTTSSYYVLLRPLMTYHDLLYSFCYDLPLRLLLLSVALRLLLLLLANSGRSTSRYTVKSPTIPHNPGQSRTIPDNPAKSREIPGVDPVTVGGRPRYGGGQTPLRPISTLSRGRVDPVTERCRPRYGKFRPCHAMPQLADTLLTHD